MYICRAAEATSNSYRAGHFVWGSDMNNLLGFFSHVFYTINSRNSNRMAKQRKKELRMAKIVNLVSVLSLLLLIAFADAQILGKDEFFSFLLQTCILLSIFSLNFYFDQFPYQTIVNDQCLPILIITLSIQFSSKNFAYLSLIVICSFSFNFFFFLKTMKSDIFKNN